MLLPGGVVVDNRDDVIRSMSGPPWSDYHLDEVRTRSLTGDVSVVTYRATAQRDLRAARGWLEAGRAPADAQLTTRPPTSPTAHHGHGLATGRPCHDQQQREIEQPRVRPEHQVADHAVHHAFGRLDHMQRNDEPGARNSRCSADGGKQQVVVTAGGVATDGSRIRQAPAGTPEALSATLTARSAPLT